MKDYIYKWRRFGFNVDANVVFREFIEQPCISSLFFHTKGNNVIFFIILLGTYIYCSITVCTN